MDSQMNLSHLSEEECQQILAVIQRDFSLRQQEKDRLEELEAEIKQEKLRSEILAKGQAFNENCCVRCFSQFYIFFNPKVQCTACKYNICKKCSIYNAKQKEYVCSLCKKQEELEVLSNKWFYSNVAERFDRFGSANVVRSMHKRRTDSDIDSDSGYHPLATSTSPAGKRRMPSFSTLEKQQTRELAGQETILAELQQKLTMIGNTIQKVHLQENLKGSELQKQYYENSVQQNIMNVKILLTSVARQLASNLNGTDSDDSSCEHMNHEQQEAISKQLLQDVISRLYSSSKLASESNRDPFAFIDPARLTLDSYTKRLSEAIINKINEDLHNSWRKTEDGVKEMEDLRGSVTALSRAPVFSDSELEHMHGSTDSMSDIDKVNFWQKSIDSNISRSESQSRMSLNQSQSEVEVPMTVLESELLSDRLTALSQEEKVRTLSRSSINSEAPSTTPSTSSALFTGGLTSENLNETIVGKQESEFEIQGAPALDLSNALEGKALCDNELENKNLALATTDESSADTTAAVKRDSLANEQTFTPDLKFDIAEYDVTQDSVSAFASRKREMLMLPDLEGDDSLSLSVDPDLELTSGLGQGQAHRPWSLSGRIPMTPQSSFRMKRGTDPHQEPSMIFLPRNTYSEAPVIGDINASELSENDSLSVTDNDSDSVEDPEEELRNTDREVLRTSNTQDDVRHAEKRQKQKRDSFAQTDETAVEIKGSWRGTRVPGEAVEIRSEHRDSCVQTFESGADQHELFIQNSQSFSAAVDSSLDFPDSGDPDAKPKFTNIPHNVVVSIGQSFKCKASLTGKKPIDVFWYRDTLRLDFDERCTVAHKGHMFSLEMVDIRLYDEGHYACIAVNEHGQCSHSFTVRVIDPDNFQKHGDKYGLARVVEKTEMNHRGKTQTVGKSPVEVLPAEKLPAISSGAKSFVPVSRGCASAVDNILCDAALAPPDVSSAVASQDSISTDVIRSAASFPSHRVSGSADPSCLLQEQSIASQTSEMGERLSVEKNTGSLQETDSGLLSGSLTAESSSSTSPVMDSNKSIDRSHAHQPYSGADFGSFPSNTQDVESSDGKIELKLSFADFEKLYESRILTPAQLKSGRFTPGEVRRIEEVLSNHEDLVEVKHANEPENEEAQTTTEFSYKSLDAKSRLYGRDYVVKDTSQDSESKPSKSYYQRLINSPDLQNFDADVSHLRTSPASQELSKICQPDSPNRSIKHTTSDYRTDPNSAVSHRLPSSASTKSHHPKSSAEIHHQELARLHDIGLPSPQTHPVDVSNLESQKDEGRLEDDISATQTTTDLEELNLPSVRSLRLLFNKHPSTAEESSFTRNYSLTARDLPNSVIAQQRQSLKQKSSRMPLLSQVSEPSGDDRPPS